MSAGPGQRVVILSAPVGSSHDRMAAAIEASLRRFSPDVQVVVLSSVATHGAVIERLVLGPARTHMEQVGWSYDVAYRLSTASATTWAASSAALNRLAAPALLRLLRVLQPHVVVSTYPMTTTVLGHLRRTGRLGVPVCAVVGPLGGLRPWCARGVDRHLVLYPEACREVVRLTGHDDVHVVRPPIDERFFVGRTRQEARAALGLPEAPTVLISGGGWGVGDLAGAIDAALRLPGVSVVAAAGNLERRRASLAVRFRGAPVRVVGYTHEMPLLMRAADVFVTGTCGLSCLEARVCGTPAVAYGFPVAHVQENVDRLEHAGLLRACSDRNRLPAVLAEAMADPPLGPDTRNGSSSDVAPLILALTAPPCSADDLPTPERLLLR